MWPRPKAARKRRNACTIACVAENKLPPGVVYRQVVEEEIGKYPNVSMKFLPKPCMQCDKRVGGCKDIGHASLQCIDLMLRL